MFYSILPQFIFILTIKALSLTNWDSNVTIALLFENEDIKNTWQTNTLKECLKLEANIYAPRLNCERKHFQYNFVDVEYFNEEPLVLKISKLVSDDYLNEIKTYYKLSNQIESQNVEGYSYSKGYQGRKADGLWLEHDVPIMQKLFRKIQNTLQINPAIAEEFLVLKYEKFGHYAIHYDHLDPMPPEYDEGWFAYYGNRLATTLLIVDTATKGGYTVFPKLNLTIQPEQGDLIFWFNADSNDRRELNSLHAACPIIEGSKMAISLWIRGNFQENLKCSLKNAGYDSRNIFKNIYDAAEPKISKQLFNRPKIPKWIFQKIERKVKNLTF